MSNTIATLRQETHQTSVVRAESWHNGFVTCGPDGYLFNVHAGQPPDKVDDDANLIITAMKDGSWTLDAGWYAPASAISSTRERTTSAFERRKGDIAQSNELRYWNSDRSAMTSICYLHNVKEITHTAKYNDNIFVDDHNRLFSVGTIVRAHNLKIPAFSEPEQAPSLAPLTTVRSDVNENDLDHDGDKGSNRGQNKDGIDGVETLSEGDFDDCDQLLQGARRADI